MSLTNADPQDLEQQKKRVRLAGHLCAIPFLSLLNVIANPASWSSIFNIMFVVFALAATSIWLAMLLLSKSALFITATSFVITPAALLLITGGNNNVVTTLVLLLSILALEARVKFYERPVLASSSILTIALASVLMASNGFAFTQFETLLALVPTGIALAFYWQRHSHKSSLGNAFVSPDHFDIASHCASETGAGVLLIDRAGKVQRVSSNFCDDVQLNKEDVSETGFLDRINVADKVVLLSELDSVNAGSFPGRFRVRLKTGGKDRTGEQVWREVICKLVKAQEGLLLFLSPFQEVAAGVNHLSQPLNATGLTIVSHELRTPLNAIIGFSDLLCKGLAGDLANEKQREYIGLIQQSGQHLLSLVNSILDLSKLENGSYELDGKEFMPVEAAEFAISMLSVQAREKQIGLDYLPVCGLSKFRGDERVVQQIAINLLSNAVKFTPLGGHISMRVNVDGDRLSIEVVDSGIGMSADELSRIGTAFYQASGGHKRLHEGAGLGLALVRHLSRLHGGAMEINSEPGKGTKVRVVLTTTKSEVNLTKLPAFSAVQESERPILLDEERDYGSLRKTA